MTKCPPLKQLGESDDRFPFMTFIMVRPTLSRLILVRPTLSHPSIKRHRMLSEKCIVVFVHRSR